MSMNKVDKGASADGVATFFMDFTKLIAGGIYIISFGSNVFVRSLVIILMMLEMRLRAVRTTRAPVCGAVTNFPHFSSAWTAGVPW
ncbi:hypothetical protein FHG87_021743 [Trinorchestia longiramus]|nr:hypothetical protein FHG87_021743 [Trinorchestia longiramus]